ncbi:MAG: ribosome silencing factor [Bacteroidia bacterium]|nr:ribosome silencing factor [Bacteroidia bacterium]MDW8348343.1 ribosome silencing factor [Bacteroidia bacterium]
MVKTKTSTATEIQENVNSTEVLISVILEGLQDKKGKEIVVMDLRHLPTSITDYFILCSGDSDTHIKALCDSVEDKVHQVLQEKPWHTEGKEFRKWILLDYISVIVHIFYPEQRRFYGLEELWGDAYFTYYDDVR